MENKVSLKKIERAPLFNRTFGALIDLALTIIVGLGVFIGLSTLCQNMPGIKAHRDDYFNTLRESYIVNVYSEDNVSLFEKNSYDGYETMFYSFYHDFMSTQVEYEHERDTYWYNVNVYGQDDVRGLYSEEELKLYRSPLAKLYGKTLFTYRLDNDSQPMLDVMALPIACENDPERELDAQTKEKLLNYYFVKDADVKNNEIAKEYKYIYYYALSDLTSLKRIIDDYNRYSLFGTTLPLIEAIFLTMLIFYFIIPMCFRDGESIGKLIMHTCLVNKLGYRYKRSQLIIRFLFPAFVVSAVLWFTGFSMITVIILSFVILASYLLVIFGKENKAIHDYLAGTLVVDKRASTFFKDINEEEKFEKQTEEFVSLIQEKEDPREDEKTIYVNPHYKEDNLKDKE